MKILAAPPLNGRFPKPATKQRYDGRHPQWHDGRHPQLPYVATALNRPGQRSSGHQNGTGWNARVKRDNRGRRPSSSPPPSPLLLLFPSSCSSSSSPSPVTSWLGGDVAGGRGCGGMGGRREVARWVCVTCAGARARPGMRCMSARGWGAWGAAAGWAGRSQSEEARVSMLFRWATMGFAVGAIAHTAKATCLPCAADQAHGKHTFFLYDFLIILSLNFRFRVSRVLHLGTQQTLFLPSASTLGTRQSNSLFHVPFLSFRQTHLFVKCILKFICEIHSTMYVPCLYTIVSCGCSFNSNLLH